MLYRLTRTNTAEITITKRVTDDDEDFIKAVLVGSLAGGSPFLLFTIPLALTFVFEPDFGGVGIVGSVWFAVAPAVIAMLFVLPASLLIGLPLTAILARNEQESVTAYAFAGGASGTLIILAILALTDSMAASWACLIGTFSGAVTGHVWAISRVGTWDGF